MFPSPGYPETSIPSHGTYICLSTNQSLDQFHPHSEYASSPSRDADAGTVSVTERATNPSPLRSSAPPLYNSSRYLACSAPQRTTTQTRCGNNCLFLPSALARQSRTTRNGLTSVIIASLQDAALLTTIREVSTPPPASPSFSQPETPMDFCAKSNSALAHLQELTPRKDLPCFSKQILLRVFHLASGAVSLPGSVHHPRGTMTR